MFHKNFFTFTAHDNADLGFQMGKVFTAQARTGIQRARRHKNWSAKRVRAQKFLVFQTQYFPEYSEELQAYAKGAHVDFLDLFTLSLEDEVEDRLTEHCTTVITDDGFLLAHNEDENEISEDQICVVQKTIEALTLFELYYYNTLGGNSVTVNSHGFVIAINSLSSKALQVGVPRNAIARFFSETNDPERALAKLDVLPRGAGYSINIVNAKQEVWNIEYNSKSVSVTRPTLPFVHTNHHLSHLKADEANLGESSRNRYRMASKLVRAQMTPMSLFGLMADTSNGAEISLTNRHTVARIIVEPAAAQIWLKRERLSGALTYPLTLLK
ncbi:hypothetical protein HYW32_00965 [Candidatus Berkelbacteria bacterium]|nr:hypothetical protein [Candidatus Berkelbacteria bacterium]